MSCVLYPQPVAYPSEPKPRIKIDVQSKVVSPCESQCGICRVPARSRAGILPCVPRPACLLFSLLLSPGIHFLRLSHSSAHNLPGLFLSLNPPFQAQSTILTLLLCCVAWLGSSNTVHILHTAVSSLVCISAIPVQQQLLGCAAPFDLKFVIGYLAVKTPVAASASPLQSVLDRPGPNLETPGSAS